MKIIADIPRLTDDHLLNGSFRTFSLLLVPTSNEIAARVTNGRFGEALAAVWTAGLGRKPPQHMVLSAPPAEPA